MGTDWAVERVGVRSRQGLDGHSKGKSQVFTVPPGLLELWAVCMRGSGKIPVS